MPTFSGRFRANAMSKYPHMIGEDVKIWNRYLKSNYKDFYSVDYDVHIGEGLPPDPAWSANIAAMAKTITQRRIDVVGYRDTQITICEVKFNPRIGVLGQLLGYKILYQQTFPNHPPPDLMLICDRCDQDLFTVLNAYPVLLRIV